MSDEKLDDTLSRIARAACVAIDWVDFASISVGGGADLMDTLGATDPRALKADALQCELGEGPSVAARLGSSLVHSQDVGIDPRWPVYATRAPELEIRAQIGVRLHAEDRVLGVLNLYATHPSGLDDDTSEVTFMLAAQATTAICLASRVETLTQAITVRRDISQAVGLVMERYHLNESRAWEYLVRVSQASQVKVRVVARELIEQANASTS